MPIINNPFNGKLNLDVAEYRISNGDYIDALNVTKDAQGISQDMVISNIIGNTLIPYTLPEGTNKVIGFYPDKIRNRAYYFLWNSDGYNSIIYYDLSNDSITTVLESKTDSDGIDILNFNPSYKVLSVNIFYRDDEGDLLFFNDGLNPPKNINVNDNYGTSWKYEYLLIAKAPPIMPPKVVYENDTTVTINNLRNKLFQFTYRYVYVNNEKSVWSSKSIVPLPQQDTLLLTDDVIFTNNSRISVSVSTGGLDVKGIEISFRETSNGFTSDWYFIKLFNKSDLSIDDNVIYTYNFYNDSLYTQIDVLETSQLQDFVPQKANAGELANGNVLLYSGITESYNKTNMNLVGNSFSDLDGYYFDYCGLLFFATSNGLNSGVYGTILKIYLFGTGTNTSNIVSILNNAYTEFVINAVDDTGTDIGMTYTNASATGNVSTILTAISNALIANGWSSSSIDNNILTISFNAGFLLQSSGNKFIETADNTVFANTWNAGYAFALQYFDAQGRTIGAQTSLTATINTPNSGYDWYSQPFLEILNRPPLEATYYQVLRSNNTTYNKRLFWISRGAYASTSQDTTVQRFAYLDISNIEDYNLQITSTQGVVSYNFVQGDRVTFLARYNANNDVIPIYEQYDFEILGTESTIVLESGVRKIGNFIKFLYPEAANNNFNFSFGALPLPFGTTAEDFLHYQIFLYNYRSNASETERLYYEFGKCYGIGNPGTSLAYHMGDITQSATSPSSSPAIVSMANGDLFFRKRKVPYNDNYTFTSGGTSQDINSIMQINVIPTSPISNSSYIVQTQEFEDNLPANFPTFSSTNYFFWNILANKALVVKLKAEFSVYQSQDNNNTNFNFRALIISSTSSSLIDLFPTQIVQSQVQTSFVLDNVISIPINSKLWLVCYTDNILAGETFTINPFNLNFQVLKNSTINIIESSFIDTYNLVTNSNGRASVIDENAKQTYFPTLIRFGGAYQVNTNINKINNFVYENFDEYDRSFGDVLRLHVRDRYLKVYQKFKVGNVPILTQIVKDSANNPLQANTDTLINKIQYYAGDYGIGDAATSLAWNNFADYFVDNYRGVVCRLSQDGITPISITNSVNAFFVAKLTAYRQELNNGVSSEVGLPYSGNPCIYGVFDAYTNKYIIAMEEINRYEPECDYNGGTATTVILDCDYNGGTAILPAIDCALVGGTFVAIPGPNTYALGLSGPAGGTFACANYYNDTTILYTDSGVTVLANGVHLYSVYNTIDAPAGFYSDSINSWEIVSGGILANQTACPMPGSLAVTQVIGGITSEQPTMDNYEWYPNATVSINMPDASDITFVVEVDYDAYLATQYISVTILSGTTTGFGQNGPFVGLVTTPNVTNACIFSCDTPSVDLTGYSC